MLATVKTITFDASMVALALGAVVRLLTALTTRVHDKTVRSVVAGAGLVVGSAAAYATNLTGDIAIWPDLVVFMGIASALVIGVDRTVIGQVFAWVDKRFPGFWRVDPNSVGIGRDAVKLSLKQTGKANAKSHPREGGTTGDPLLDALGPPDVDASEVVPPPSDGGTPLAPPPGA